jgi:N-acetyl-alpha-D-muramate 1-phosphate uridylyltransferase
MDIRQIVILAGGLATRLRPITEKIPKSMVAVAGKPFLEHQIALCKKNGVKEIVLCVGHLWEQIRDHFGDGNRFGVKMVYSVENERLDTGGALKNALPYLGKEFFVMYGDSYLTADWQTAARVFKEYGDGGLMTVFRNDGTLGVPSQITVKGNRVIEFTKTDFNPEMKFVEYGLNIFGRDTITQISENSFPISRYFDLLIAKKQLLSYESPKRYYEIGCPEGLAELEQFLA